MALLSFDIPIKILILFCLISMCCSTLVVNEPINDHKLEMFEEFDMEIKDSMFSNDDNSTIYTTVSTNEWVTYELTNPSLLDVLEYQFTSPISRGTVVVDEIAYFICQKTKGLQILDVSNFGYFEIIGSYFPTGSSNPYDISVLEGYAYVVDKNYGLMTFDISNPKNPILLSTLFVYSTSNNAPRHISAHRFNHTNQTIVFVCNSDLGVYIIDVSDPSTPSTLQYLSTSKTREVKIRGDFGYFGEFFGDGLVIYNLTNVSSPKIASEMPGNNILSLTHYSMNLTFICVNGGKIRVVNTSDPYKPQIINEVSSGDYNGEGVVMNENYMFVAYDDDMDNIDPPYKGFGVFDVSNKVNPIFLSSINSHSAYGVFLSADLLYVTAGYDIIQIYNVSTYPPLKVSTNLQHMGTRVFSLQLVDDKYLFTAQMNGGGLSVYDISNSKKKPVVKGMLSFLSSTFWSFIVDDEFLYACEEPFNYLSIYKLSYPNETYPLFNFTTVSQFTMSELSKDLYVKGNFSYVGKTYLRVINMTDRQNMEEIASISMDWIYHISGEGDFVYVTLGESVAIVHRKCF